LGFHVPFDGVGLFGAVEQDGEFEDTAWYFCVAEVAELGFEIDEVRDQMFLGYFETVVVD